MVTIENILFRLNEYISWFYSQTGLARWQLLTIALVVLILMLFLLRRQRKTTSGKIHTIKVQDRPETIGAKLTDHSTAHLSTKGVQKHGIAATPQETEKHKRWKQTTEEWKTSSENIRQLQREVAKYKRSEDHLKYQLAELEAANEQLISEIDQYKKAEKKLKQQIAELSAPGTKIQSEPAKQKNTQKELAQQPEDSASAIESTQGQIHEDEQPEEQQDEVKLVEPDNEDQKTSIAEDRQDDEIPSDEESEQSGGSKRRGVPLDIQELEAIADLVKRLRQRSPNQQNKSL